MEKHYVYKVSVMPISGAAKPYKTLVKTALRKVQNWYPQNLIKHVVYGGFSRPVAKKVPENSEKALGLEGFRVALPPFSKKMEKPLNSWSKLNFTRW